MKFIELTIKEFENFSKSHPLTSFHQTKEWGDLKKTNGWESFFVGIKKNNEVIAASLILAKKLPLINKKMFYAPRGFLIDYNTYEELEYFTKELKKFAKNKGAIFIKIDPYLSYQERDNEGNIVKDGFNNFNSYNNLIKLKYKHFGFNMLQEELQPRWIHTLDTNNKTLEEIFEKMESKTRQIIRKNEKSAIISREIAKDELNLFKNIMQHTGDRRNFIDRPLSYYENMWDNLGDMMKIYVAEINFSKYINNLEEELSIIKDNLNDRINKYENNLLKMNEKKYLQSNKSDEDTITRLNNQIKKQKELKEEFGEIKPLGAIMFLIQGNEVLSLFGGSLKELMQFQSAYTLHFEGIKLAVNNHYKKYNFYGITGDFSKNNPLLGLYLFKKSFGGQVEELIGEFDLVISPFWYNFYNVSYRLYRKIKK